VTVGEVDQWDDWDHTIGIATGVLTFVVGEVISGGNHVVAAFAGLLVGYVVDRAVGAWEAAGSIPYGEKAGDRIISTVYGDWEETIIVRDGSVVAHEWEAR